MSRASRAHRIATAAAYGSGGLGALAGLGGAVLVGLIIGESKLARRRIPQAVGDAPPTDNTTWTAQGVHSTHNPVQLAMLGDSLAAGYGVDTPAQTPAALLAGGISAALHRPVHVSNLAIVGAETPRLAEQLASLETRGAALDLAVIIVGANDITHRVKPVDSVRGLEAAVRHLDQRGIAVVVGTCPDLGTIRPIWQPLRAYVRRQSRTLAAAQTVGAVRAGGRTVSLADLLGPLFSASAALFGEDQFHPSAAGYAAAAEAILPSCLEALAALGVGGALGVAGAPGVGDGPGHTAPSLPHLLPGTLDRIAAEAVARPGAEVAPAAVPGERHGLWRRLRRHRAP